ncbi:methylmalonyl Co-A mutase-associated GTPase MeaB [Pseudonocardia sp. NPDC046786]|uniref:methylmalonyl Co-A mutase-associated GTPase MeaB n=2 Tax=Pseudonocardia TaxID=1847 RepID=UPI0033E3E19B
MPGPPDPHELVERARAGQQLAVARLISMVENAGPQLRAVSAALTPHTGGAHVVGLTGSPGVGKSTSTSALVSELRARDRRVGVLAVDPSSPFSGGALLGDRVRMGEHADDDGVFIRSMATRGHLGGLSWATPQALRVLDAAGCDVILIETVGVGQSEVEIVGLADSTVVLMAPGMGDGIQAAKAGILEIGDVFVVNKADREGARRTVRELRNMLHLRDHGGTDAWEAPVLMTVASRSEGIGALADALDDHLAWARKSGERDRRRHERVRREIEAIGMEQVRARMERVRGGDALEALTGRVLAGELDPWAAADELLGQSR